MHDIGKNLVDIIFTNNGYEVRNLGIKVPLSDMLDAAREMGADAIGMSGLLVKSTLIMRENLLEMNERGLATIPVILGGAALTRTYVERDLRSEYHGRLFYGKDAFEGLHTMDRLMELKRGGVDDPDFGRVPRGPRGSPPPSRPGRRAPAGPSAMPPIRSARRGRPRWRPTTPCSFLRSSVPGSSGASPSTTSPPTSTRPPSSGPSGATGPTSPARRPTPSSRTASGASCGSSWPRPAPPGCSSRRSPTAISPSTPKATT